MDTHMLKGIQNLQGGTALEEGAGSLSRGNQRPACSSFKCLYPVGRPGGSISLMSAPILLAAVVGLLYEQLYEQSVLFTVFSFWEEARY